MSYRNQKEKRRALRLKETRQSNRVLRAIIREVLQSHTDEPSLGDHVVNVNPGCKHYGSEGIVVKLEQLPQDMGTVACYRCTNNGDNWSEGEVLRKSLDQLELS